MPATPEMPQLRELDAKSAFVDLVTDHVRLDELKRAVDVAVNWCAKALDGGTAKPDQAGGGAAAVRTPLAKAHDWVYARFNERRKQHNLVRGYDCVNGGELEPTVDEKQYAVVQVSEFHDHLIKSRLARRSKQRLTPALDAVGYEIPKNSRRGCVSRSVVASSVSISTRKSWNLCQLGHGS